MTDYEEEQRNEIEAIESIYPDEFTIIREENPHCFQIHLETSGVDKEDNTEITVGVQLQFTFVETYPDEAPIIEVLFPVGISDEDVTQLTDFLTEQAEENLGMVMVFTIVSSTQEKLEEFVENIKKQKQDERIRKQREEEEAEKIKFTGAAVTKESFAAWRVKFDQEMAEKNKGLAVIVTKSKITGRKLFEMDASLIDSDSAFFEGGDVQVDESLFQGMEDLELDDEEFS